MLLRALLALLLFLTPAWADGINAPGVPHPIGSAGSKGSAVKTPPGGGGGGGCVANCMITPIMGLNVGTSPTATATNYIFPYGGGWSTTLLSKQLIMPVAGTLSGLEVLVPTAVASNFYTFSLVVNGAVASAVQCSVGQGGTNLGTTTACNDPADTVTVNAGDLVSVQSAVPGGTATALAGSTTVSFNFTSTVGQESLVAGANSASGTLTQYWNLGPINGPQTTDALASSVMPTAGTLDWLNAAVGGAPGAGKQFQFTVMKNGVATAIVAGDATHCGGASSLTCSDLTHSVAVVAGDTISIQTAPTGTPSASASVASLRFVPTTLNQAILIAAPGSFPTGTLTSNHFIPVAGPTTNATAENTTQNIAPVLATHMTLGGLYVAQCPGPDTTASTVTRAFTLRSGAASQSPTVTTTGNTACPTLTAQQDTTHTYAASSAALLDLLTAVNTTTNAAALTELKISMTVTVP
jgi:hypothetical protein